jgi:hypothetical protein
VKLIREFFRSLLVEFFPTVRPTKRLTNAEKERRCVWTSAKKEGVIAGKKRFKRAENPYPRGCVEYVGWDCGWLEGKEMKW